jgi:pimeloyl-ACP methyl ester carboxylesterase
MTRVGQGYLQDVMHETIASQYLSIGNQSNQELKSQLESTALALGAEVFVRQSLALRDRRDSVRALRDILCPTLVLCGREDALCPVAVHEETAAAIITADLTVLSGAGHLAVMERADAVTEALSHLMSRAPSARIARAPHLHDA